MPASTRLSCFRCGQGPYNLALSSMGIATLPEFPLPSSVHAADSIVARLQDVSAAYSLSRHVRCRPADIIGRSTAEHPTHNPHPRSGHSSARTSAPARKFTLAPCNALRAPQSPPFPARPGDVVSRPAASRPTGPPRSRPVGQCPARACTAQRLLELSPANCNCAGASAHASR